jgi:hypothetical protein
MRLLLGLGLAGIVAVAAIPRLALAADVEPKRERQESFIARAVYARGTLRLLSDAGELSSIKEGSDQRNVTTLGQPVLDLRIEGTQPIAITCDTDACAHWLLYGWQDNGWKQETSVASDADRFLTGSGLRDSVLVLTSRRLITITSQQQGSVNLSPSLRRAPITSVLVTDKDAYVAFDAGEWGGGLERVNRTTGAVTAIERNSSGELCGGPLNTDCDPVNGLALEPWNANCVAAAVGLVHMSPHGRIVEVCNNDVRRLYFKAYGDQPPNSGGNSKNDEPFSTVAFFGLAAGRDSLWATGIDGIYKLGEHGQAQIEPLPKFKEFGGVYASFSEPDMILVLTDINRRRSVSGSVPLLLPR